MNKRGKLKWSLWLSSLVDGGSLPRLSRTLRALHEDNGARSYSQTADRIKEDREYVERVFRAVTIALYPPSPLPDATCDEQQFQMIDAQDAFAHALEYHAEIQRHATGWQATMLRYRAFLLAIETTPELIDRLPSPHPALSRDWQRGPYRAKEARYDVLARWLNDQPSLSFAVTDDNLKQIWRRLKQLVKDEPELAEANELWRTAKRALEECQRPIQTRRNLPTPSTPARGDVP